MNFPSVNLQNALNRQVYTNKPATSAMSCTPLRDLEFDMVADKIRSENIKNQMNIKIPYLKRNLSSFINGQNA